MKGKVAMVNVAPAMPRQLESTFPKWYVMLLPDARGRSEYLELASRLAAVTGGTPDAEPHVTIAYFQGYADKAHTTRRLGRLRAPNQLIRAHGLFSFSDEPHPLFGYTLLMRVVKDDRLRRLHERVRGAVGRGGLILVRPWEDVDVHVRLLQHLPHPPSVALAQLGTSDYSLEFSADALLVTEMVEGGFEEWLRQPLNPARLLSVGPRQDRTELDPLRLQRA